MIYIMNDELRYRQKYLKYKQKYTQLIQEQSGGATINEINKIKLVNTDNENKIITLTNRADAIKLELRVNHLGDDWNSIGDFLYYFGANKAYYNQLKNQAKNMDVIYITDEQYNTLIKLQDMTDKQYIEFYTELRDSLNPPKAEDRVPDNQDILYNQDIWYNYIIGPAQAICSLHRKDDSHVATLTLDWLYDAIYFEFPIGSSIKRIVLGYGPKTTRNEFHELYYLQSNVIRIFKSLSRKIRDRMKEHLPSSQIGAALTELSEITDLFV